MTIFHINSNTSSHSDESKTQLVHCKYLVKSSHSKRRLSLWMMLCVEVLNLNSEDINICTYRIILYFDGLFFHTVCLLVSMMIIICMCHSLSEYMWKMWLYGLICPYRERSSTMGALATTCWLKISPILCAGVCLISTIMLRSGRVMGGGPFPVHATQKCVIRESKQLQKIRLQAPQLRNTRFHVYVEI